MLKKERRVAIIMIQDQDQDNGALHETRDRIMRWGQGVLKEGIFSDSPFYLVLKVWVRKALVLKDELYWIEQFASVIHLVDPFDHPIQVLCQNYQTSS